jgi:beta-lactamase class C
VFSRPSRRHAAGLFAAGLIALGPGGVLAVSAAEPSDATVRKAVDEAMRPVMERHGVPGLAVAVTIAGKRHFFEYGLASKSPRLPVTRETLFELGSISKTFTATLATYAEGQGRLSLRDPVSRHLPALKGSAFDDVALLDLATHTAGGFPLQVPEQIRSQAELMTYFREWKPRFAAGTQRNYANPSIGLLGMIVAGSLNGGFAEAMERRLFPELGLRRTYVSVPAAEMKTYAWGHSRSDAPIRVAPGLLASEAYGVKSNTTDMIRFVEVNMGVGTEAGAAGRAALAAQTGHYRAGEMVQALIWERYPYPVDLRTLLAGNAPRMAFETTPASRIEPPMPPRPDMLLNKTGSTNGFGAYVAFIPARKLGIVMLANKNYPIEARVTAAHAVLSRLAAAD